VTHPGAATGAPVAPHCFPSKAMITMFGLSAARIAAEPGSSPAGWSLRGAGRFLPARGSRGCQAGLARALVTSLTPGLYASHLEVEGLSPTVLARA